MVIDMLFNSYARRISKILSKAIIAHFRYRKNIDVAYKSKYCKDIHFIYIMIGFKTHILEALNYLKSASEFRIFDRLIDWIEFYSVSAISQSCNGGDL